MKKSTNLFAKSFLPMLFSIAIMFGTNHMLLGQVSEGGIPYSFSTSIRGEIQTITMGPVDVAALLAEDEAEERQGVPVPFRFGFPFEADLGLDNAGIWTELPNGDRIWRLRIVSPGAFSINLLYDEFWLPEGAKFFIYNDNRSMVIGAFTAANNKKHGKFSTAPVQGNISILEYYEPSFAQGTGKLHISRVVHAYRNFFSTSGKGTLNKIQEFGGSASCNINVNCPEGAPWTNEKRAVIMILLSNGTRWCSGAMINNVREDLIPYLLTAFHCIDINENGVISDSEKNDAEQWIIMFNYESPNCSDINGPTNQTVSGTTLKASNSASDFALLRLSNTTDFV